MSEPSRAKLEKPIVDRGLSLIIGRVTFPINRVVFVIVESTNHELFVGAKLGFISPPKGHLNRYQTDQQRLTWSPPFTPQARSEEEVWWANVSIGIRWPIHWCSNDRCIKLSARLPDLSRCDLLLKGYTQSKVSTNKSLVLAKMHGQMLAACFE